jgi:hypothetical protein
VASVHVFSSQERAETILRGGIVFFNLKTWGAPRGLGELGWIVGRNVRIDYRWGAGYAERYRAIAAELVALAPDVVLALGYSTVSALQKATGSVPPPGSQFGGVR